MNGLEAIELMQQGKVVIEVEDSPCDPFVFKIIGGNVCFKYPDEDENEYQVAAAFDFTATYTEYIEPKLLTGWERLDKHTEDYFAIDIAGKIKKENMYFGIIYNTLYDYANAFSTKEKAEEIDFKQTLFRKLQRFSDENGGLDIDWKNEKRKFKIHYDHRNNKLCVSPNQKEQFFGQVYFISGEIAKKAIELFHDDLIKYFTHDWSGKNE